MNPLFSFLALLSGIALAVQAAINGGLGKRVGALEGAFLSFLVGTIALWLMLIVTGKGAMPSIAGVPKWLLTGGLLGVIYVASTIFIVPKIGVAPALVIIVSGQLLMGAVIDHFALFGGRHIAFDMKKLIAICLVGAAIYLFYKK